MKTHEADEADGAYGAGGRGSLLRLKTSRTRISMSRCQGQRGPVSNRKLGASVDPRVPMIYPGRNFRDVRDCEVHLVDCLEGPPVSAQPLEGKKCWLMQVCRTSMMGW